MSFANRMTSSLVLELDHYEDWSKYLLLGNAHLVVHASKKPVSIRLKDPTHPAVQRVASARCCSPSGHGFVMFPAFQNGPLHPSLADLTQH
jgi:hypothetical protein